MDNTPSVLIISFSDHARDPRVHRQIRYFLDRGAQVTCLGEGAPEETEVSFISSSIPYQWRFRARKLMRLLHLYEYCYWQDRQIEHCVRELENRRFDLIVANDIDALPIALHCAHDAKVLFDAHEYAPREFEDRLLWRWLHQGMRTYLCQQYIPRCDAMITVCEGIAKEYTRNFNKKCGVITNAPFRSNFDPQPPQGDSIRMIYHGAATESRGVEQVVEIMNRLDERFHLDMILIPGSEPYIEKIRTLAASHPRIRFIDPVPMPEIPRLCNGYDLGFFPLKPSNFNYQHALPNKFFEFLQARIAPAISPQPEMARLVEHYDCGVVSADYGTDAFVQVLSKLDRERLWQMKQNTEQAAVELCAEENFKRFDVICSELEISLDRQLVSATD